MVFSSSIFLCFFLPLFLVLYYLTDRKYKNFVLLFSSVLFYAWGAPKFVFVIIGTTILDFFFVKMLDMNKAKWTRIIFLLLSVLMNVGLLVYFKYSNFFVENVNSFLHAMGVEGQITWTKLVLPIGISFYTFETLTYVIDVYRGVHKPLKNFWDYQLYIILFPKLIAGPIIRYHEIADQIPDRSSRDNVDEKLMGFYRFCLGLGKKVLIANTMAQFADSVYGNAVTGEGALDPAMVSAGTAWFAAIAYTLQIYFDFSGYSDMAIGIGRMIGFRFPENFNNPYVSESITDFWRRWHITLGSWMRNYLYIPLGGNRVSPMRLYFNLWLVFLLSGLWHGASWNFIFWGAWHGFFLVIERLFLLKLTARIGRIPRILFTMFIVVIGWVFFRVEHVKQAWRYVKAMFGRTTGEISQLPDLEWHTTFVIALLFSFFVLVRQGQKLQDKVYGIPTLSRRGHIGMTVCSVLLFVLSLSYVTGSSFNPFIYFRF
jgi:alginate O-acetyltransferase complex protein AlgI